MSVTQHVLEEKDEGNLCIPGGGPVLLRDQDEQPLSLRRRVREEDEQVTPALKKEEEPRSSRRTSDLQGGPGPPVHFRDEVKLMSQL